MFRSIIRFALAGVLVLGVTVPKQPNDRAGRTPVTHCSAPYLVDVTFANGARWHLCWEQRLNEGIVLRDIYYTAVGGDERLVLHQANLAQTHVPYDDNSARFHDLSDFGLGGSHLITLTSAECLGGTLLQYNGRNVLCAKIEPRGYDWKFNTNQVQGQRLTLFSASQIGHYTYVPQWVFNDEGSIEPSLGATGHLARYTTNPRYGWLLSGNNDYGTSHTHNMWWRLDFDLVDSTNDLVEEMEFENSTLSTRPISITALPIEAGRPVDPTRFRFWRIRDQNVTNADGHPISYEIEPMSSHTFRGPGYEPWTANDFYVTQYNPCERWVSHNPTGQGCGSNLATFVNGEAVQDAVLWYVVPFHHVPRDEDEPNMLVHWLGFHIVPRDWTATNPIP